MCAAIRRKRNHWISLSESHGLQGHFLKGESAKQGFVHQTMPVPLFRSAQLGVED